MKAIKLFYEDVRIGFQDYGVKFLPRLLLFPFVLIVVMVLTIAHDRVQRW